MTPPLPALLGSQSAAQVLLFLQNYGEGHARRIATTFGVAHMAIQRQLRPLQDAGAVVSRKVGNTRVFGWNPRSAAVRDLRTLLEAELERLPRDVTEAYFRQRQRPRRTGKPLSPVTITADTTAVELAALVSQVLKAAAIKAAQCLERGTPAPRAHPGQGWPAFHPPGHNAVPGVPGRTTRVR